MDRSRGYGEKQPKNNIPFTAKLVQVFILNQTQGSLITYH